MVEATSVRTRAAVGSIAVQVRGRAYRQYRYIVMLLDVSQWTLLTSSFRKGLGMRHPKESVDRDVKDPWL